MVVSHGLFNLTVVKQAQMLHIGRHYETYRKQKALEVAPLRTAASNSQMEKGFKIIQTENPPFSDLSELVTHLVRAFC